MDEMKHSFTPISIENFIKSFIKDNPKEDPKELRKRLQEALKDYKNGETCDCGNKIWVIGSACVGNGCFTCITGEGCPDDDYEIEGALS